MSIYLNVVNNIPPISEKNNVLPLYFKKEIWVFCRNKGNTPYVPRTLNPIFFQNLCTKIN